MDRLSDVGFGIYVHWPYCAAKCPYCDFNSHVPRAAVDERRYAGAIIRELEHVAALTPGRRVETIFFGGGTPSLMRPETVHTVIAAIAALWPVAPDAEITLEANPSSVEAARFAGYRAAGVNRVSLGVQSLRDEALRFLGRLHSAAQARQAVSVAQTHFERVSIDLIYARPGQSVLAWRDELREALALGVRHLSAYQLTIEPGTSFFRLHEAGKLVTPPDDAASALFETTQELCARAGLAAYEISNHAAPGDESRHNLIYWRYGDYAGVGPGAHGRLSLDAGVRAATETVRDPAAWLAQVERDGQGIASEARLAPLEQAEEMLLMGLRLTEGVSLARLRALTGHDVAPATLEELHALGLIAVGEDRVRVTEQGRLLLNQIALKLADALYVPGAPVAATV
jgi:putative oxygen-independent coproporphyrinogen III oxidase